MSLSLHATRAALHVFGVIDRRVLRSDDRGDVPAWVMITVMTAGIVGVLWTFAQTQLQSLLTSAFSSATSKH